MTHSLSEKIIKNTAANAVGRFWSILVAVFLTPYILQHVGIERFGIWAVINVLTGYFGLLDFALGAAFVKYISEYHARKDHKGIGRLISTGTILYSMFGALLIVLVFMATGPLLGLFKIPGELYGEAVFVFRVGIVVFVIYNIFSAFQAIQTGLQRMDITNRISIGMSVPMVLGTVLFLENGYGLRGLILNKAIIFLMTGAIDVAVGYRLLPELKFSPLSLTREMFGKLFSFGYRMQVARIAEMVVYHTDRLLIAGFLGMGDVGIYQLGSSAAYQLRSMSLMLVSALLPAASDLDAKAERDKLRTLYLRGTKYLALVSFPLIFLAMAAAPLIMLVWVGAGYGKAALALQFLALAYLANLLVGVGTSVSAAIGKPEFQMKAGIVSAVSVLILCPALILTLGFFGAAAATAVSFSSGMIYFFFKLHRQMGLSTKEVAAGTCLAPLCAALPPALGIGVLHYWLAPAIMGAGRAAGLGILVAEGLAFAGIYLAVILKSGHLDGYDRDMARKAVMYLRSGMSLSDG